MRYLVFAAILFVAACNTKTTEQVATTEGQASTENEAVASFGADISVDGAVDIKTAINNFSGDSAMVKVSGNIVEVCQAKGCWLTLETGAEPVRVTFKDYGFFVPKDSDGSLAVMDGILKKEEVSVETLRHYAQDAGKSQEEIDAITEPELKFTFEASGVVISDVASTQ